MERFINSNNNNKRTIAPGMPPLPPSSQRMKGQSSPNPNIDTQKLKRQYAQSYRMKQTCRIMQLEWTVQSLEANIQRDSTMMRYLTRQNYFFHAENGILKQKLSFFSHEIRFKEAECARLKKEKDKLQQQSYEELLKSNMGNAQFMDMDQTGRTAYNFMQAMRLKML